MRRALQTLFLLVASALGTPAEAQPRIDSVRPTGGAPGVRIRIRGAELDKVNAVLVGGTRVEFERPSARVIAFVLPNQGGQLLLLTQGGMTRGPELHVSDAPTIAELEPYPADPGRPLTLRGANLNPDRIDVFLDDRRLAISSASATELVVLVPSDAVSGTLRVVNPEAEMTRELEVLPPFEAEVVQRGAFYEGDRIELRGVGLAGVQIEVTQEFQRGREPDAPPELASLTPRVRSSGQRATFRAPAIAPAEDEAWTLLRLAAVDTFGRRRELPVQVVPTEAFDANASARRECEESRCVISIRGSGFPLRRVVARAGRTRLPLLGQSRTEIRLEETAPNTGEVVVRVGGRRLRILGVSGRCLCD
ncbi:MAG: IPT/TIG domain-containing protein [Myxococcota bacterium]